MEKFKFFKDDAGREMRTKKKKGKYKNKNKNNTKNTFDLARQIIKLSVSQPFYKNDIYFNLLKNLFTRR